MQKMNNNQNGVVAPGAGKKKNVFFKNILAALKKDYSVLILSGVSFLVLAIICFFGVTKNFTVAGRYLEKYEVGQISFDTFVAEKAIKANAAYPFGIAAGEEIIKEGFPVTEDGYRKLEKMSKAEDYIDYRSYADTLLFLFLLMILWTFLCSDTLLGRKAAFKELLIQIVFFISIYTIAMFAKQFSFFASSQYYLSIAIPTAMFVFLIALLFDEKSAVYFSIIVSLGVLNASEFQFVTFLFTLGTAMCATRIVRKIETRIDMVFASLAMAAINVVFMIVMTVLFDEHVDNLGVMIFGLAFNGFISGILALGFITPLEQVLNTASVFRLMDLSDLNNPTMRKLLLNASGTYNHSMMVATLAENACKAIGANFLVARVGAYYHDIGKMDQSEYFVENQNGHNKHDDMNPSLSVSVIRSHVKRGVEKAHQLHLPPQIIDIISEHHGNSVIAYFYGEEKKINPDVREEDFSYNGVPPTTRESAVVMLADTVEAACRTLEKPSVSRLDKFIQQLIGSKLEHHQLDNCPLTFRELNIIRESFVTILAGYYHSRIEYPDQKDPDADEKTSVPEKNDNGKTEKVNAAVEVKSSKTTPVKKAAAKAKGKK